MRIKNLYIMAFRNISRMYYSFDSRMSVLNGNNMRGKTNTLNAIYWCLTGTDLNGSNDNSLNIPYKQDEADVRVVLEDGTEIKRIAKNINDKVVQTIYINDEKMTLKAAEQKINELLGISQIAAYDTKGVKALRFLLNPLYYRSVATSELRKWVISLLFSRNESNIIENSTLNYIAKKQVLNGLKEHNSISEYSKYIDSQIKNLNANVNLNQNTLDFLASKNNHNYDEELNEKIEQDKKELLTLAENNISVDEAANILSKYYQQSLNARNYEIVLIEKAKEEDSWKDVCYPRLTTELPLKNGSTAEIIFVSCWFVQDICRKFDIDSLPMLIDEGETLDNKITKDLLNKFTNQFILTKVAYENMEGVELCRVD